MLYGTAVWKCPALCGCAIRMTALWTDDSLPIENGEPTSYRHPSALPGLPITVMDIVSVCAQHTSLPTDPFPADPYYGAVGYIPIPASPTPAERLYIHLYKYRSQLSVPSGSCTCRISEHFDRSGVEPLTIKQHPHYSRKCPLHVNDDDQHTRAREEGSRRDRTLNQIVSLLSIDPGDPTPAMKGRFAALLGVITYVVVGDTRVLHVNLTSLGATTQQKNNAQNWCNTNLGVGLVVIE